MDYARRHLIIISVLLSAIVITSIFRFVIPANRWGRELPNSIAALNKIREKLNEHVAEQNWLKFLMPSAAMEQCLGYWLWKRTHNSAVILLSH
jgi:hypothetical protein